MADLAHLQYPISNELRSKIERACVVLSDSIGLSGTKVNAVMVFDAALRDFLAKKRYRTDRDWLTIKSMYALEHHRPNRTRTGITLPQENLEVLSDVAAEVASRLSVRNSLSTAAVVVLLHYLKQFET